MENNFKVPSYYNSVELQTRLDIKNEIGVLKIIGITSYLDIKWRHYNVRLFPVTTATIFKPQKPKPMKYTKEAIKTILAEVEHKVFLFKSKLRKTTPDRRTKILGAAKGYWYSSSRNYRRNLWMDKHLPDMGEWDNVSAQQLTYPQFLHYVAVDIFNRYHEAERLKKYVGITFEGVLTDIQSPYLFKETGTVKAFYNTNCSCGITADKLFEWYDRMVSASAQAM